MSGDPTPFGLAQKARRETLAKLDAMVTRCTECGAWIMPARYMRRQHGHIWDYLEAVAA
jgi:hypothetical protein